MPYLTIPPATYQYAAAVTKIALAPLDYVHSAFRMHVPSYAVGEKRLVRTPLLSRDQAGTLAAIPTGATVVVQQTRPDPDGFVDVCYCERTIGVYIGDLAYCTDLYRVEGWNM